MIDVPSFHADPGSDGTNSGVFYPRESCPQSWLSLVERVMRRRNQEVHLHDHELPSSLAGVLSMHCSANAGPKGDVALSSGYREQARQLFRRILSVGLIGDDEHGWSDDGIFNFEGGCYAKVIRLIRGSRARDLRLHAEVWNRAGERCGRSGDATPRSGRRFAHREYPRSSIRCSSSAMPWFPAWAAIRKTSSCSLAMPLVCCHPSRS